MLCPRPNDIKFCGAESAVGDYPRREACGQEPSHEYLRKAIDKACRSRWHSAKRARAFVDDGVRRLLDQRAARRQSVHKIVGRRCGASDAREYVDALRPELLIQASREGGGPCLSAGIHREVRCTNEPRHRRHEHQPTTFVACT